MAKTISPEMEETIREIFEYWRDNAGRTTQTILSDARKKLIRIAIEKYDVETVRDAVDGWRYSRFHLGYNDSHKVYNDIELLLRNPANIERFANMTRDARHMGKEPGIPIRKKSADQVRRETDPARKGIGDFGQAGVWDRRTGAIQAVNGQPAAENVNESTSRFAQAGVWSKKADSA